MSANPEIPKDYFQSRTVYRIDTHGKFCHGYDLYVKVSTRQFEILTEPYLYLQTFDSYERALELIGLIEQVSVTNIVQISAEEASNFNPPFHLLQE